MRITNSTLTTNYLRNLTRNLEHMQKYQNQLSSGKVVSRPSDDPLLVSKIMDLNNNILQNEQYNKNISDSIGWVRTQDGALNNVSATLNRIRDLMIYGANGTLDDTSRTAIKDEVGMKIQELADVLNTNFDGRYIFAGQKTLNKPFEVVGLPNDYWLSYNHGGNDSDGSKENITREISKGVTVDLITAGSMITETTDTTAPENKKLGALLNYVMRALDGGTEDDIEKLGGDFLKDLDNHIDNILQIRSK